MRGGCPVVAPSHGFVVLDAQGRWAGASPEWRPLLESLPAPGIGRPLVECLATGSRDLWVGRLLAHGRGDSVPPFEIVFADWPGTRFRANLAQVAAGQVVVHLLPLPDAEDARRTRVLAVLRDLYAYFPSGVILMDLDGVVLWVNGKVAGMGGRNWPGRSLARCLPGVGLGRLLARVARMATPARLRGLEIPAAGLGAIHNLDLMIHRVDHPEAAGFGLVAMVDDATARVREERRRVSEAAAHHRVERLKSDFLSSASHELRTPLTLITGFAEFLEDGLGGALSERQAEFVRGIQTGARQMQQMVDDLLDFSKLQDGTFQLRCHEIEVSRIVREVMASLAARGRDHEVRMVSRLEPGNVPAWGDPEAVARILHALLGNALKFTPPGGAIEIRVVQEDRRLLIEVEDDGVGIAPEHLPHIFERFYQADPGLTRLHGGAGLGLAVARALVTGQRGRIGVRSHAGAGSCFWFTLPLLPRESSKA